MSKRESLLYNGLVETCARVWAVTEWVQPLTLQQYRMLDVFCLYPGDLGAPLNLHHPNDGRANPFNFREPAILQALDVLEALGVLETFVASGETSYILRSPRGPRFSDGASEKYAVTLSASGEWLGSRMAEEGREAFFGRMARKLDELLLLDPFAYPSMPQADRFVRLREAYRLDLMRIGCIEETAFRLEMRIGKETPSAVPGPDYFAQVMAAAREERASVSALAKGLDEVIEKNQA